MPEPTPPQTTDPVALLAELRALFPGLSDEQFKAGIVNAMITVRHNQKMADATTRKTQKGVKVHIPVGAHLRWQGGDFNITASSKTAFTATARPGTTINPNRLPK